MSDVAAVAEPEVEEEDDKESQWIPMNLAPREPSL